MDKVKIGFPIEYEYGGIIYDGLFLRESEIKELEKRLKEINKITEFEQQCKKQKEVIDKTIGYIQENTCWELRTSKVLDILKEVSK